jgi:signal transduction histidine kinase
MKTSQRSIVILSLLFGYILLQFLWWEVLLVRQNDRIINEKQKLMELASTDAAKLKSDIDLLHHKKEMQTVMIVSEGTVFLLLLLFGMYKIKQAIDKERSLNNQQNNFFLSITHELKTPIAATKLQLQTLQKQKLDENTRQELINNALMENDRLNTLIDNVLLASRLETDAFVLKTQETDLGNLVDSIAKRYYKTEIDKSEIILDIKQNVYAAIDEQAFPSIVTNLVDNAIKYSGDPKKITVSLAKENNEAVLCVKDEGRGIDDRDKEKIFDKFFRSGNEETRSSKGTGLGLYIVNYIAKKHQARILVKNNTPKGTIVELRLHAV